MSCNDLKKLIKEANEAYREGNPIMSDAEYDHLEFELKRLSPDDEWFKKGVNDSKPKDREMELPYPMMSLNKVKNHDDLMLWIRKYTNATFIITPKYDGLSVGLKGDVAWTRGNGVIGQNCSQHVDRIYIKPQMENDEVVRGEIIIDNADWGKFKKINENAKSPRNSATGLINGDFDVKRNEEYGLLRIMPYEIQGSILDKEEQLKKLLNQNYVKVTNIQRMDEEYLLSLFIAWKRLYPIDGLVIDVNEDKYRHSVEANGNPSYAIAYKHPNFSEVGYGVIDRVERNVNRRGYVTPVLWLKEPISLSGADIQRVSAINMRYIFDWGLFPNETVTIIRSGEVIPKIIGVGDTLIPFRESFKTMKEYEEVYKCEVSERQNKIMTSEDVMALQLCPVCGAPLEKLYVDGDWCEMVCNNVFCDGRKYANIIKFFELCGVDGFGEKSFEQLMECGLIGESFFNAFNIEYANLLELEGWGELNSKKFLVEMNRIKNDLPFAKFLHATGWFADLGEKTLQKIIDAGLCWLRMDGSWRVDGLYEELLMVEGVQDITARKFVDGVNLYNENLELISVNKFNFKYIETPKNDGPLDGMVICATGFRDQEMFKKIKELGGLVGDGVTKSTTCLIVKDLSSSSSKLKKAEKMGIEILDIDGFKTKYFE